MMHRTAWALALVLGAGTVLPLYGQPTWQTLPNAPVASRHNDAYFVTPALGWIVNGAGEIYKTADSGASWQLQVDQRASHFRSVGFIDDQRGWAGNVGLGEFGTTDSTVLYQTRDGGASWMPIDTFIGPKPKGLCGMHVVTDSVVVGVGRVRGPSFFVKTTDGGTSWTSQDMSAYAAGLIDIHFFHPDSGFAVGLTHVDHEQSSGVVLFTSDGGLSWEKRFTTTRTGEWSWKISFPSRTVGYVSLQRNSRTPIYFLKTTDGGLSWQEILFSETYYFVQGIGFATERLGWIGGNSSFPTFQTTDGGATWQPADFGARVNRFRFLSDTLGYAVGRRVYRYTTEPATGVAAVEHALPRSLLLHPNYPNPFNPATTIRYVLPAPAKVRITVYDVTGRHLRVLLNQQQSAGEQTIAWDGTDDTGRILPSGVYLYTIEAGPARQTRMMVRLR